MSYKDHRRVAAYLRQVYTALDEQTARDALEDFHASELGSNTRWPIMYEITHGVDSYRFCS